MVCCARTNHRFTLSRKWRRNRSHPLEACPCAGAELTSVEYGGLGKDSWSRLLGSPSLSVRLVALRALSSMGPEGAEVLLRQPLHNERYPWMWAVRKSLGPDQDPGPGRARFLARWDRRPHTWKVKRELAHCARAMAEAEHSVHILSCAVRLLALHGEHAIPALLELIRKRPTDPLDEKAECAAWALGTLGSAILPEVLDCYQGASPRVRGHLAMALWYLGPRAYKALPVLLDDPSPQASAALLAMEGVACEAMVARGRGPVWLDVKGVQALARLAFGDDEKARTFAAAGLGCFGPDATSGVPILEHLAQDQAVTVRLTVARGLGWGERRDALNVVLLLTEDPREIVREAANQAMRTLFESAIPARQALLDRVVNGPSSVRKAAAAQLAQVGLPPDRQEEVAELLEQAPPVLLPYLLEAADICGGIGFHRQPMLALVDQDRGPEARCAVVRTLAPFLDTEGFARLRELLFDGEEEVALLAARLLARKGMTRIGLGKRLLQVPPFTLIELLQALHTEGYPEGVEAAEWLPLLEHSYAEINCLAARALGKLAGTGRVTPEVVAGLTDLLDSPHDDVVLAAARTLLEFGLDEIGYEAVETLLEHRDQRISFLCAHLLGRRGLRGVPLLRLPAPTLHELLKAAREANFPNTDEADLLLLLKYPDPTILRMAAEALGEWAGALLSVPQPSPDGVVIAQEPRPVTPELLEGLRTLLESSDRLVRVAGARALVHLGHEDVLWVLLESPADAGWVRTRLTTVPEELLDAVARGRCLSAPAFDLLRSQLAPPDFAELLACSLVNAGPGEVTLVRAALINLGLAGLEVLPELLGHPAAEARSEAMLVLGKLLYTNLDTYVEWLAERGLVLPLDHPDLATQVSLHVLLASFIEYAKAWRSERFLPLLEVLLRSPSPRAARLALGCLTHLDAGALILEAARSHPADEVRLAAMRHLRWSASPELALAVAAWPPDPDSRVELQRLALEYRVSGLESKRLRRVLQSLAGPEDDSMFLPARPDQFVEVAALLADPEVGNTALRLLRGHPGEVGRAAWAQLVRSVRTCHPAVARALVLKWPRLVVSLLKTPDGAARIAQLGGAAEEGLRLARKHRGVSRRIPPDASPSGNPGESSPAGPPPGSG